MYSLKPSAELLAKRFTYIGRPSFCTATVKTVDSSHKDALGEEEIERKRNISRLPERAYVRGIKKQYTQPKYEFEYVMKKMRRDYANFGRSTGINPGIMWPTKDELKEIMYYDKKFNPPLSELLAKEKERQRLAAEEIQKREEEVESNMAKLDAWRIAMLEKEAKKRTKAEEERIKKEQMILEVREYIGYNVDPSDPKFKEVMEMKEEERRKAEKAAKKKAKQERILAKLMAVAGAEEPGKQEQKEKEADKDKGVLDELK